MCVPARIVVSLVIFCLALMAQASEDADWVRNVARVPDKGATTWSIVVTTGHFGGDPQLAESTRQKILELLSEVGAKGDRTRVFAAEMSVWGTPVEVEIENLSNALPVSQAPKSKGGRDIEMILQQVGKSAKGPVLIFSPGASLLPSDGSGSLVGGNGAVEGFEPPQKRMIKVSSLPKERFIQLTVLSRRDLFSGTSPRLSADLRTPGDSAKPSAVSPLQVVKESRAESQPWPFWVAGAVVLGIGCGYLLGSRRQDSGNLDNAPDDSSPAQDASELIVWKEQAKSLQRRLDYVSQEIEESVQKMSDNNDLQIIELRQELMRRQKSLDAWDELVIDYLDGIQRALDHHQTTLEAAGAWSRARAQLLQLTKRLGLDEIRPAPGDPHISSMHRVEAIVAPTSHFESGVVTRLIESGYRRGDAVIRQAKVEIASENI